MNVLHIIPSINLSQGGPSRTSINLVNALSESCGCKVFFYTYEPSDNNHLELSPSVVAFMQPVRSLILFQLLFLDFLRIRSLIEIHDIDLLHIHGVWHPLGHWSARAAASKGIPYIIQPRGMLETWSMRFKRMKKFIAMLVYQRKDLREASGFIATSEQEADSIRLLVRSVDVVTIPNGVERPLNVTANYHESQLKTALFMSRIHPKKGVYELVEAWGKLRPSGWRLRIVGPDDGGHLKSICELVVSLRLDGFVEVVGPLYGEARAREYASAYLFILPTYSENFGVAVTEALSYGVPVLTTKGAPWSSLVDYQCGWWIDTGEESLVSNLPKALSMSDEERLKMGSKAKELASKFDWTNVARQTFSFYSKIISVSQKKKRSQTC